MVLFDFRFNLSKERLLNFIFNKKNTFNYIKKNSKFIKQLLNYKFFNKWF
jgi:hypothetical protein